MEGRNQYAPNAVYAPPQQQIHSELLRRSPWLIALGFLEIFPSLLLMGWSVWILIWGTFTKVAYVGCICGGVHLTVAVLAIIGGRKGIIIALLITCMVGSCVFAPAAIGVSFANWDDYDKLCQLCEFFKSTICPKECTELDAELLFLPVIILSLIAATIAIILASISCCNICYCCGCCYADSRPQDFQITYHPVAMYPQTQTQPPPPGYIDGVDKYDGRTFTNIART